MDSSMIIKIAAKTRGVLVENPDRTRELKVTATVMENILRNV